MSEISIALRGGKSRFRPSETIEGSVNWNLSAAPKSVEIRLMWQTRGKGTEDASVIETTTVASPGAMGDSSFRFTLPDAPHSFRGQLIALVWLVEVSVRPMKGRDWQSESIEFELSPFDAPIVLPKLDKPLTPLEAKRQSRAVDFAQKRGLKMDKE